MKQWKELAERVALAWGILRDNDSPLTRYVRRELDLVDPSVALHAANMARVFALEGHSGGSAPIMISWLERALSWQPIRPLTGADDEWNDVSEHMGKPCWQNNRCGAVFKDASGAARHVGATVWREPNGACYTNGKSQVPVTFPYHPKYTYVDVPMDATA